MRSIPATMGTQHPDNATAPYWDPAKRPFIGTYQEINEAVDNFQTLNVDEYMWDWEGKFADAAVIDRLFSDYYDYFSRTQLGKDKYLTFRIPNIWEEKGYSLLQAMTAMLSSEDFARDLKLERPLFETILPMTERADQLLQMQQLFEKLADFKNTQFTPGQTPNTTYLEMIPLVESVESQQGVAELLAQYVKMHQKHFKFTPDYIRTFIACSDSALSSGLLAGLIGNKIALSNMFRFGAEHNIQIFPIAGSGSLRFRGGPSPTTINRFIEEYPGVRTVTVQSAFRYDYPLDEVKAAIKQLQTKLPKNQPRIIDEKTKASLIKIGQKSAGYYKETLAAIAPDMQQIFKAVPKRRDRRQHIGLVAYARSMGGQSLPRAITFTGGFYSIGVPPEIIGLGRALQQLTTTELATLTQAYPNIAADMQAAGRYFNADNLAALAKQNSAWRAVQEDVKGIESVLGIKLLPETEAEVAHHKLAGQAFATTDNDQLTEFITEMAICRKSIG